MGPIDAFELMMSLATTILTPAQCRFHRVLRDEETPHLRLMVRRMSSGLTESEAADMLGVSLDLYLTQEKRGNPVDEPLFAKASQKWVCPLDWLLCRAGGDAQADVYGNPLPPPSSDHHP